MDNQEVVTRANALMKERSGSVDQVWELIERFIVPLRGKFYTTLDNENNVDWRRREVYDSTAVFACQALAASLHGNLTSPSQKWFDLRFRDNDLNEDDAAKEWLEDSSNRVHQALQESNFDVEIAEAYMDLVSFGTAVMTEEVEDDGTLVFSAIPLRDVNFEEDYKKQARMVFRKFKWTASQIVSKFDKDKIPQKIKDQAANAKNSVTRHDIVFAIYPRDNVEADPDIEAAPSQRPWGYKYVLEKPITLLEEGGYYEMPAFIPRWRKTAGSKWGRSPGTVALSDILELNQVVEATNEAAGKAIDPPVKSLENSLQGNLDLDRGGINIVRDMDDLQPIESGSRFDVSNMKIDMLRQSIRQAFYQDQLELKESPAMTATEVNVRYELMQRLLGPTLGRLKFDLLDPLIERTFRILFRTNLLDDMPESLSGAEFDIDYLGPLARSQRSDEADAIIRTMSELASLVEIFPGLRDRIDEDKASLKLCQLRGVPADVLRSERELVDKRKEDAEMAQAMQAAQAAQMAGDAMKSVGEGAQSLQVVEQ